MDESPPEADDVPEAIERRMLEIADLPLADREGAAAIFCREHPEHAQAMASILAAVARPETTQPDQPHATAEALTAALTPGPRYAVQGEIAQGGMGVILRAQDRAIQRVLAMKVTRDQRHAGRPVSPQVLQRFLKEARLTGQLEHPGVVPVHDLGVDEHGRTYFTMRLVRGRTADEVFDLARAGAKGWRLERALEVLVKVCDTLAYAHSRGVIHRDLKPGNVMVGDFGEVYVMDWGLARALTADGTAVGGDAATADAAADPGLTQEGQVMGTPSYMPPEQAEGRLSDIGPRSDVYAVGAMLYALLAGSPPYLASGQRSSAAILAAVRAGPPQDVATLDPQAPPELIAVCQKAMQRQVELRYADMAALGADLRAYLDGRVVRAFRTGAWAELKSWVRRNKGLAAGIGVAMLAVTAGLVVVSLALRSEHAAHQQAQAERATARFKQYVANLASVAAAVRDSEPDAALKGLDECPAEHRGFEWSHLRRCADSSASTALLDKEALSLGVLDAERIVIGMGDGIAEIRESRSGRTLATLPGHNDRIAGIDTTKDGRVVTASFDGTLRVWRADTASCERTLSGHESRVWGVAVAPDGKRVASAAQDGTARIWDLASGRCEAVLKGHRQGVPCVAWFPDGSRVATASPDGTAAVWNAATGERLREFSSPGAEFYSVAVPPDGTSVAAGSVDSTIHVWDLTEKPKLTVLRGHTGRVKHCLFTPDGAWLVSAGDRTIRVWSRRTLQCTSIRNGHRGQVMGLAMAADGCHLLSVAADNTLRSWQLDLEPGRTSLVGHRSNVRTVHVSPDGRQAITGGFDQTVRVWDLASGSCTRVLRGHTEIIRSAVLLSEPGGGPSRRAASCGNDHSARLWDVATGECLAVMQAREIMVAMVAEADGLDAIVTVDDIGGIWLWDRATGRQLACLSDAADLRGTLSAVAPEGRLVVSPRSQGPVVVWDLVARRPATKFGDDLPRRTALCVSPDGSRLFLGDPDGKVHVVDTRDGRPLAAIAAHSAEITDLAVSADGRRLVSVSVYDSTVRLFDTVSFDTLAVLPLGTECRPMSVVVAPDTRSIVVGGEGRVLVLHGDLEAADAESRAAGLTLARRAREEVGRLRRDGVILPADVREAVGAAAGLDPDVRAAVLRMLEVEGNDPDAWRRAAWTLLLVPTRPAAVYPRALRVAAAVAEKLPDDVDASLTVGAAQMRCGQGAAAVATLTALEGRIAKNQQARWLALMALSLLAADDKDKADAAARRLRRVRSVAEGRNDVEANLLAEEVEKRLGS